MNKPYSDNHIRKAFNHGPKKKRMIWFLDSLFQLDYIKITTVCFFNFPLCLYLLLAFETI